MERFALCPRCQGAGYVANPSLDGMTRDDLFEAYDPSEYEEFIKEYGTRGGVFDILCPRCGSARVVLACETLPCKNAREWIGSTEFEHCVEHLTDEEKEGLEDLISMYQQEAAERAVGA